MTEQLVESAENPIALEGDNNLAKSQLKIWDLPTRVFHWLLVVSFIAAYITNWTLESQN